jgi:glyoxylase-like metal-dependent hydrolase (beta-lactamase superfamily II)
MTVTTPASRKAASALTRGGLTYPLERKPEPGEALEVAEGVRWVRMPLPFALNHINLWLLDDGEAGWAIVDTGLKLRETEELWQRIFSEGLDGRPVSRVIVTHLHPDHVGLAGWLTRKWNTDLWMTRTDYLMCRVLAYDTGREAPEDGVRFYRAAGFTEAQLERYVKRFGMFGHGVMAMPESYRRIRDGDTLYIGGRNWHVITGGGHAPEHATLWCPELQLYISGDQVLPTITSNVSVWPTEPHADPLSEWLESSRRIKAAVPGDVLVLPAHQRPFRGLHLRIGQLVEGHEEGLDGLVKLLREPRRAVDTFGTLFKREVTDDLLIMAAGEAVAHLNTLLARGMAEVERDADGVDWYRAV